MLQLKTGEEIEKMLLDAGYFPTEELVWKTALYANKFILATENKGQAVSALCLDGPPGSGKTEFVLKYRDVVEQCLGEKVNFIQYQCTNTTGREDLFEEINIKAVVQNDAENVILRGKLVDAIEKLNKGERVILFLDEFDKAKEETDDFLLSFLQSGQVFSTQLGSIQVEPQYLRNLQVFVVKNDKRERLTGPLESRLDYLHLSEMQPDILLKVLMRAYGEDNAKLVQLCAVLYEVQFLQKERLEKISSCRECLVAVKNCLDLMRVNAPESVIYATLLDGMCKLRDDKAVFLDCLKRDSNTKELCNLFGSLAEKREVSALSSLLLFKREEEIAEKEQKLAQKDSELAKQFEMLKARGEELNAKLEEAEKIVQQLKQKQNKIEKEREL